MNILSQVAKAMQEVLTESADNIARCTKFVKRLRKLSGSAFVQTLVFGWLSNPDSTVEELTQSAATLGISISPQGLDKRFTPQASDCMKKVLETAVATVIADEPVAVPLLQRFNGIHIQDGSTTTLPDSLCTIWKGCGGSTAKNTSSSIKIQVRLDLNTGKLTGPYLQSGKEHDKSIQLEQLPAGALRIADLSYFSLNDFKALNADGIYWLSRVKSVCEVYDEDDKRWDLVSFLEKHCKDSMDMQIYLGVSKRVPCRLLAIRASDEDAKLRRCKFISEARSKGEKVSDKVLRLASWYILCCNVPIELLRIDEAYVLMRTRWQIELIFKLWKSHGKIDEWRSKDPWRILCEVYAKLIAMVIQHWILLLGCWQYPDRSIFKAVKTIRKYSMSLALAFSCKSEYLLYEALEAIKRCLSSGCRINKSKKDPRTYQLLLSFS